MEMPVDIFLISVDEHIYVLHCVKSVRIRSSSGPHFSAFVLNIHSKWGKMLTRGTPNTDTFYAVLIGVFNKYFHSTIQFLR